MSSIPERVGDAFLALNAWYDNVDYRLGLWRIFRFGKITLVVLILIGVVVCSAALLPRWIRW